MRPSRSSTPTSARASPRAERELGERVVQPRRRERRLAERATSASPPHPPRRPRAGHGVRRPQAAAVAHERRRRAPAARPRSPRERARGRTAAAGTRRLQRVRRGARLHGLPDGVGEGAVAAAATHESAAELHERPGADQLGDRGLRHVRRRAGRAPRRRAPRRGASPSAASTISARRRRAPARRGGRGRAASPPWRGGRGSSTVPPADGRRRAEACGRRRGRRAAWRAASSSRSCASPAAPAASALARRAGRPGRADGRRPVQDLHVRPGAERRPRRDGP